MVRMAVWTALSGCVVSPPPVLDDTDDDTVDTDPVDTTPLPGGGAEVLLLDDGGSGDQVRDALEAAGHTVVAQIDYWRWDGTGPRARDVEVIVWLQGLSYADGLAGTADRGLVNFVNNGGGLIRTEAASYAATVDPELEIDALLPVELLEPALVEDIEWQVWQRGHELVQGIPELWVEEGSSAMVAPADDADVVMVMQGGTPLVTISTAHGGTIIHINHDMTGTTRTISTEILGLMANAVSYVRP